MGRLLKIGAGWRVGWDANAPEYPGLMGTDDWALELTAAEMQDFCRLLEKLDQTVRQIATELMDEETLTCELESELLWLEAVGFPDSYDLRLILRLGRKVEGYWPQTAVPGLRQALHTIETF